MNVTTIRKSDGDEVEFTEGEDTGILYVSDSVESVAVVIYPDDARTLGHALLDWAHKADND